MIKKVSLFELNDNGDLLIFDTSGQGQTYVEGLIFSSLVIAFAVISYSVYYFSKLPIFIGRDILIILSLSLCFVAVSELCKAYTLKTPWYVIERLFPRYFSNWISKPINKNSNILERVFHLLRFTYFECQNLASFVAKAKSLLHVKIV